MLDLNDLAWFVQVVDHEGFAAAGRALDQPKSKLSRRIAQLEERLGVRLIHRTTRQFVVTEVGQTFYQHCKAMLIEAEAAQQAVETLSSEPRGSVKLTCPVTLLHAHVGPMLARFMLRYPGVNVQLEATNRRVDVVGDAGTGRPRTASGRQPGLYCANGEATGAIAAEYVAGTESRCRKASA